MELEKTVVSFLLLLLWLVGSANIGSWQGAFGDYCETSYLSQSRWLLHSEEWLCFCLSSAFQMLRKFIAFAVLVNHIQNSGIKDL